MKKIPIFLLLFMSIMFVSVFASQVPVEDDSHVIIYNYNGSKYALVGPKGSIIYKNTQSGHYFFTISKPFTRYKSDSEKGWVYASTVDPVYSVSIPESGILSSNYDIKDNKGDVFFSGIPPKYLISVAEMGQVSLGTLMTDFGQTLATLLPIGLILSSMVLALYLVRRFLPLFGLSSK